MLEKTNYDASHAVSYCTSNHIKNKDIEKQPFPKHLGEDTFTSQKTLIETVEIDDTISGSFCHKVDPTIFNMLTAFSPLVDLIMGLSHSEKDQDNSKEDVVLNLSNVLKSIQSNIGNNKELNEKLSKRANEALSRLYKSISAIEGNKDIKSMDIKELIAHWKENKSHKALLEMAEKIRNGECSHISNRDLRRGLIEGLESFAASLEEASSHPQSKARDEAIQALEEGASNIVDNADIIEEKGGDENLTEEEKETISENFQNAKEKAEEVTNDPEKSRFIEQTKHELTSWTSYINRFISQWNAEIKEEEIKEEKKKEKEICRLRHSKEKEIAEYKRSLNSKKKLVNKFNFIQNKIKGKIERLLSLLKFGKTKNPDQITNELRTYRKRESRVDSKFNDFAQKESYVESKHSMAIFELELSTMLDGNVDCEC